VWGGDGWGSRLVGGGSGRGGLGRGGTEDGGHQLMHTLMRTRARARTHASTRARAHTAVDVDDTGAQALCEQQTAHGIVAPAYHVITYTYHIIP